MTEPLDDHEQLLEALRKDPDVEVYRRREPTATEELRSDAKYAGSAAGSAVGGTLGSFAGQLLAEHRATALVIGTGATVAVGVAVAMRVVPKTFGLTVAWLSAGLILAGGGIIVAAAITHALRDPRWRGMS